MIVITIIYTLVFVLAFPTLADAECAWVLWEQINTKPYEARSSWPDKDSCLKEQRRNLDTSDALRSPLWKSDDAVAFALPNSKHQFVISYRCLPDNVDPREAKGGGR